VVSIKQLKSIGSDSLITNTISVNGKGESISIPDVATFSFSVTETAKTVQGAQEKTTVKTNNTLKSIKAGGVAEKDIKTLSYSINPHYEYNQVACTQYVCPPGRSVLTGYDVSQTIEVKVRDLSKAGALFEAIGSTGVQNVNGLNFSIDNIESVKTIARAEAIKNAKAKAQKIAKELGVRLVKVTSFYDSSDDQPYIYSRDESLDMGGIMTMKASVAPSIPQGEQKVTAYVTITYEIR
jgi:uncharacterized protein